MDEILAVATKEVFAFAFAAASLVAAYRRLKSAAPQMEKSFDTLCSEIFADRPLQEFIKELRNNFGHSSLFEAQPQYTITFGERRRVTTDLRFERAALLAGTWNTPAQAFIDNSKTLDVMEIISDYFRRADELHRRYPSATGLEHDPRFKDFIRLNEARKVISTQITLSL